MIIEHQHANGVVLVGIYSAEELGENFRDEFGEVLSEKKWAQEYETFRLFRNKRGELIRVCGCDIKPGARKNVSANLMDALLYQYGNRRQKADARKRIERAAVQANIPKARALRAVGDAIKFKEHDESNKS